MAGSTERIQDLQAEIARRAAAPEAEQVEGRAVLAFSLAGERYAFPLSAVREVCRVGAITPLPGLPPAVLGAMGLRGEVLAVLDLRRLLGLPAGAITAASRLLIVAQGALAAALLVDEVEDIATLPAGQLQPPPADAGGTGLPFLQAIGREGEQLTRLLDPVALLEAVRHGG